MSGFCKLGHNFTFKWALHFSTLAIKLLNSGTKLQLLRQHYEPVFFETLCNLFDTPTFKTKALRLVSNAQPV